eukprot:SAG31_NODE_7666_length_1622_cov_2.162837_3_plen_200_part_01
MQHTKLVVLGCYCDIVNTACYRVGWLQKYVPEDALGGKNTQSLIVGKLCSLFSLLSSVAAALYADMDFFTYLQYGFCAIWVFIFPMWVGGAFFKSIKSPPVILTGLVCFPLAIYYEQYVYLEKGGFLLGYPTSAFFIGMFVIGILTVSSAVFNGIFPDFDDHENKMFMAWDAIGTELDRCGVQPKRKGARMLAQVDSWSV